MPQLKEDEWPTDNQPTTSEEEQTKDDQKRPLRQATPPEYPPKLPPDALPTKD